VVCPYPAQRLADTAPVDLYALPPAEFTAARDAQVAQARRDGNRALAAQLRGLRRPTASAYAVNRLVRQAPDLVEELLELGAALARAQVAGSGVALRELGLQRRHLVTTMVDRARTPVGRPLPAPVRVEVTATLEAAMSDTACAQAVRSGRLVRALSYAGFGQGDLDGAVAPPAAPVLPAPDRPAPEPGPTPAVADASEQELADQRARREAEAKRVERLAAARALVLDAAGALDDAVRAAEHGEQVRTALAAACADAQAAVQAAEVAVATARERCDAAAGELERATRDLERVHARVTHAQSAADRGRAALDRLEGA